MKLIKEEILNETEKMKLVKEEWENGQTCIRVILKNENGEVYSIFELDLDTNKNIFKILKDEDILIQNEIK